jgi:glycosyltransferase involved in cell wall biosynthesis
LEQAGMLVTVQSLLSDSLLRSRYALGSYPLWQLFWAYVGRCRALLWRGQVDALWIEKEALPWLPLWLERSLLGRTPYVLDYDDAIFHAYDQHRSLWVRRLYGHRLDGLMARAALVVCGNQYLAQRARDAGAARVEVVPTVIDLDRYPRRQGVPATPIASDGVLRIVWIGSPSTVSYLRLLTGPLQTLAKTQPFVLRVIGGGSIDMPGVQLEVVEWSEDTEVDVIGECDIGVMPLVDSAWERGKCGYKLIQYMACGLPVVASNVGVNAEIVQQRVSGLLVDSGQEWVAALGALLDDPFLRREMGLAGRARVEGNYCVQRTGPRVIELLQSVAAGG